MKESHLVLCLRIHTSINPLPLVPADLQYHLQKAQLEAGFQVKGKSPTLKPLQPKPIKMPRQTLNCQLSLTIQQAIEGCILLLTSKNSLEMVKKHVAGQMFSAEINTYQCHSTGGTLYKEMLSDEGCIILVLCLKKDNFHLKAKCLIQVEDKTAWREAHMEEHIPVLRRVLQVKRTKKQPFLSSQRFILLGQEDPQVHKRYLGKNFKRPGNTEQYFSQHTLPQKLQLRDFLKWRLYHCLLWFTVFCGSAFQSPAEPCAVEYGWALHSLPP